MLEGYLGELGRRGITVDRSAVRRRLVAPAIRHATRSTLGVAMWEPKSDREARLIEVGISRARSAIEWLGRTEPSVVPG